MPVAVWKEWHFTSLWEQEASMSASSRDIDVLVAGAGPVGLSMACELRRHGVACRIIDKEVGPTPPEQSRALGIHAATLEVFETLGVLGPALQRGRRVRGLDAYHGGRRFAHFELDFSGLGTPYPFLLSLSQGETERVLIERLAELGGAVEWRTPLEGLSQDAEGVTVTLGMDGGSRQARAGWVVGCDGAHSTVRHHLGLAFAGDSYPEKFLLADVRLVWQLSQDEGHLLITPEGPIAAFPLPQPGRWRLIDATGTTDVDEPAAIFTRLSDLLRRSGLKGVSISDPEWASSFHISRRAAGHFQAGRCFLAGDAAHVHSPVGGQGMNTGIQDAHNLAWKLALVNAGAAPESLLSTYEAERLPVAQAVLRGTDRATWVATLKNPVGQAIRNLVIDWLSRLAFVRRRLTRELSELGISYRGSPVVAEDWAGDGLPDAPRPGDRAPDVTLGAHAGALTRLFDLLRGTQHTLLLLEGAEPANDRALDAVADLVRVRWPGRVVPWRVSRHPEADGPAPDRRVPDPEGRLHRLLGARHACLYLVRPDGHVGYRASPPDASRFARYMGRVLN
jgi:2-polyprenyl-6-methoxyphenol hydroxylase-like FAD-dependent oxidoreductase